MAHHALVRSEWIGPSSWTTWAAGTVYALGAYVIPPAPNGFYYKLTTLGSGTSGPTAEPWVTPTGSTTVADANGLVWTCMYSTSLLASELAQLDASLQALINAGPPPLVEIPSSGPPITAWVHNHVYLLGQCTTPTHPNGLYYQQTARTTGESGAVEPTWPTTPGASVVDSGSTWTCQGSANFEGDGGGGTYAPTTPIIIGGQGLRLNTGVPVVVLRGGTLTMLNVGGIVFGTASGPYFSPPRSRTIQYSCAVGLGWPNFAWRARWADGGMQAVCGLIDLSDGNGPQPVSLKVPLRAHNGATLSQVQVNFRIGFTHQALPSVMPMFRVVRVDASGNVTALTSKAAGGDPNGYVSTTAPASVAGWAGNQATVITCDQANVVDLTRYTYYVEIVEEQTPSGYPWTLVAKQPVKAVLDVTDATLFGSSPATADGVTINAGDRFAVIVSGGAAAFGVFVGIYTSGGANVPVSRAADFTGPSDFSQGVIVPVDQGNALGGAYLQAASTSATWDPKSLPGAAFEWNDQGGAGFNYGSGAIAYAILPTVPNGFFYSNKATGGTGGTSEPHWPTAVGDSVADGAATLTCMGPTGDALSLVMRPELDDEIAGYAGTGFFLHGNVYDCVQATFTNIQNGSFQ